MNNPSRRASLLLSALLLALLPWLPGCSGGGPSEAPPGETGAAAPGDDPSGEILKWQARRDLSARTSAMSPFTAVQAHYVDEGDTARIGADGKAAARDPGGPMKAMAAITYTGDAFQVEPVEGSEPPFIHYVDDDGEPEAGGTEVEDVYVLEGDEVVGIDRYFLSMSPQSGFGRILVFDPEAEMRKEFHGFEWFPPNPDLRVKATWVPAAAPTEVTIGTSRGLEKTFQRAGHFEFEVDGTRQILVALSGSPQPEVGESLFLPFQDATTGKETYEIGRYISVTFKGPGEDHFIDFNRATNPLCNYSTHYNCPLPPGENRLTVAIRAGEMTYPVHGS